MTSFIYIFGLAMLTVFFLAGLTVFCTFLATWICNLCVKKWIELDYIRGYVWYRHEFEKWYEENKRGAISSLPKK